jgi:integrase
LARTTQFPEPSIPRTFSSWITKRQTTDRYQDPKTGERKTRTVDCWDLRGRADGVIWSKRFPRAGLAQTWKDRLDAGMAAGLPFDMASKQFVLPEAPPGPPVITVFELTERYFRQHPDWEPKTKMGAANSFGRARRWLTVPGVVLEGADLVAVEDFIDNASFLPEHLAGTMTERQQAGEAWLRAHSLPADALTAAQVEAFVARYEVNQRFPDRKVSAATLTRFLQPIKGCWSWAVSREDIPVERNPWLVIRPRRKVKGKATLDTGRAGLAVDSDMVLSIDQSLAVAKACAEQSWGGVSAAFILVMALSGLRPGEAAGLLWEDVDLPADGQGSGWVTVRRTHRPVAARWLDVGEDASWGPLKDRDLTDSRRAPIPPLLVAKLVAHRELYQPGPGGLVFHRNGKPFDHDMFNYAVWRPGRGSLWPLREGMAFDDPRQPKLARLRRHDLRHAACSWWLREGVDAVVCQRWSGHKTLSVFLDIYQGVAPGREEEGVAKLEASVERQQR